ncbi:hypothetical protein JOF53_007316 [Crossiella equi]|uniref:DUF4407 domain-containing protein n=1 Tax=Crossiella equi TaxID=130796 RepID=A0ABS5APF5_9PSEU|nr:DUF4407 domain-containing protein [Crossiella equi]MBP2478444.1 hypothetical protein [Crossiella equi]
MKPRKTEDREDPATPRPGPVRDVLARLAGGRVDLLARAPGDRARYSTMGGVLVATAAVAGVSAFFALYSVLELAWPLAALAGLGWAALILTLDRMLVVSMSDSGSAGRNLLMALPRVLLALVLGTVVSTPLVLRVFQQEINAELTTMHAEQVRAARTTLDATYARVGVLAEEERELQDLASGRATRPVSEDPDVKAAQGEYDGANRTYQEAQRQAQCELDGTCGTGRPGTGGSYKQKQAAADDARRVRDAAKAKLDRTTGEAEQRLRAGAASEIAAAQAKLPRVRRDLAAEQERARIADETVNKTASENSGVLARLEALGRVTGGHLTGQLTHLMVFLLFLGIEILPVLVKLLNALGPKTLYDHLVAEDDRRRREQDTRHAAQELELADIKAAGRRALTEYQVRAQQEAAQEAAEELVVHQKRMTLNAIRTWGNVAVAHTDRQLGHWMHQQARELEDKTIPIPRIIDPEGTRP